MSIAALDIFHDDMIPMSPPLGSMNSFPEFIDEKISIKEDTKSVTRSECAISDSNQNAGEDFEIKDAAGDTETQHNERFKKAKKCSNGKKIVSFNPK